MSSLRRRISIGVIGITSVVVLVAALGIWMATRTVLLHGIDHELTQRVERIRNRDGAPIANGWRPRSSNQWSPNESRERSDPRRFIQVVSLADGHELARSNPLLEGCRLGEGAGEAPAITVLPNGQRVRSIGVRLKQVPSFLDAIGDNLAIPCIARIGIDLDQFDTELLRMGRMLAALWFTATVLAGGFVLLFGSAILRPVRELSDAIGRLGPDDLAARVLATSGPDEVRGMVQRLNGLLDRLEQAFRREQATIASIAHELRTPVATLRSDIEFRLLANPGAEETVVLQSNLKTVERMQAMVTNLLLLARLEAGKEPLPREQVDVTVIVTDAVEAWSEQARVHGKTIRTNVSESILTFGSIVHLRLIIDNLLSNAVDHGITGDIGVSLAHSPVSSRLTVSNLCAGTIDVAQLGQTFYRGDAARSGGDHCGLGLALCRRLARLSGYAFSMSVADGYFIAVLDMPSEPR